MHLRKFSGSAMLASYSFFVNAFDLVAAPGPMRYGSVNLPFQVDAVFTHAVPHGHSVDA